MKVSNGFHLRRCAPGILKCNIQNSAVDTVQARLPICYGRSGFEEIDMPLNVTAAFRKALEHRILQAGSPLRVAQCARNILVNFALAGVAQFVGKTANRTALSSPRAALKAVLARD